MNTTVESKHRPQRGTEKDAELAAGIVNGLLRFGIIVTDSSGTVIEADEMARKMIVAAHGHWPEGATCCSLFGCLHTEPVKRHCISALAAQSQEPLPEIRVDLPPDRPSCAVW